MHISTRPISKSKSALFEILLRIQSWIWSFSNLLTSLVFCWHNIILSSIHFLFIWGEEEILVMDEIVEKANNNLSWFEIPGKIANLNEYWKKNQPEQVWRGWDAFVPTRAARPHARKHFSLESFPHFWPLFGDEFKVAETLKLLPFHSFVGVLIRRLYQREQNHPGCKGSRS